MTSQENPLWRFKPCVSEVYRFIDDVAMIATRVNRARFTVIKKCLSPTSGEEVMLCEFYGDALDGDSFILPAHFSWQWDELVDRA
jgi:hypothetical protein